MKYHLVGFYSKITIINYFGGKKSFIRNLWDIFIKKKHAIKLSKFYFYLKKCHFHYISKQ